MITLYKSLVRPKLEYCIQAWNPFLKRDITLLENVQRRATKLITGLKNKSYEERLSLLQLTTSETRRKRGDLIQTFKILKKFDNVNSTVWFKSSSTGLRGHEYKLFKHPCRLDIRKYFLVNELSAIGINYQQMSSTSAQ